MDDYSTKMFSEKRNALVVVNDPVIRKVIKKHFSGKGYLTDGADSMIQAAERLHEKKYQLAILDEKLSDGTDGFSLMENLSLFDPSICLILLHNLSTRPSYYQLEN